MSAPLTLVADSPNLAERYGFLSDLIGANFGAEWQAKPMSDHHQPARISWAEADGFGISRAEMVPLQLHGKPTNAARSTKYWVYSANHVTRVDLGSLGQVSVLPGELLVLGNAIPCRWTMLQDYVCLNAVVEADLFDQYIPDPDRILGRKFTFPYGLNAVLMGLMDSAWKLALDGQFAEGSKRLIRSFLETLSFALAARPPAEQEDPSSLQLRREQVKQYIQRNYQTDALTIESIGRDLGLSTRYIQMAFAAENSSPLAYLRNLRLDAAATRLRDPHAGNRGITQIAYDCGFGSSAHFATEFKRRFGVTPREYRNAIQST